MSSLAFQKFKSLDRRSQSVTRMGDKNRPSPDQGLGSSVSSSNTSLQLLQNNLKNEEQQDNSKPSMAKLREQFFTEKTPKEQPEQEGQKDESSENQVLDRRKSLDNNQTKKMDNNKIDALNNTQDIKSMFEQNIAVKKGLIPDPASQNKGPVVKMRRKVNPNLPNIFAKNEDEESKKRNHRESVPIDRKMFNHFLNKFEDDQSRAVGKSQLWHLTQKQKDYLSKEKSMSWSKKQEEKRLEEERKLFEEQQAKELEEQRLREEIERLEKEAREAEERKKLEEEEKEALKRAQEAEDKKKKKKKVKKTKQSEAKELPNLVANTCSDLRRKFQESLKVSNDVEKKPTQLERPRPARKLIQNPFEKQHGNNEVASVKRREVPVPKENRLGDIKKRFSQLITSSDPVPVPLSKNKSAANIGGNNGDEPDLNQGDIPIDNTSGTQNDNEASPAVNKRVGLVKSSMEALKGSFEKLTNSKEKLGGAFASKKSKKPSVADMQSYLISHVLYDGTDKVQMEATPSTKKEDNLFDFLEEEAEIPEEELMNDEAIKRMKSLLVFLDEDKKSSSKKKKKKKKKVEEPAAAPLKLQQVGSIKEQFEIARKQNLMGYQKDASEAINLEPTVGKVKTLFEQAKPEEQKKNLPIRRQTKLISNELIQKFDCPEMADELKKQRELDREERKKERLRRLEEERQKIEAERRRAQKLEEERLEKERQEQLKREEEERLQREKEEEEKRIQIAYEKMVEEEKRKAELRSEHEKQQKAKREKSEPAFRQKKVLGRIQHIFQKKMDEESPPSPKQLQIGSVKGVGEGLFAKKDEVNKPMMNDPSLAGVGGVLNSVKNKFEVKEEAPVPISHGVSIKKKEIPGALAFAQKEPEPEVTSPKPQTTDWSWKKKDKAQLAAEMVKTDGDSVHQKKASSKALRAKKSEDRQRELLADIHAMNDRLAKKNALKEHEAKMEEYSKFMDEIQNYLTEPDQSTEESTFKDDIKTFITSKLTTKKQKKTPPVQPPKKTEPEPVSSSVSKIKEQLLQSNDTTDARLFDPAIVNTGKVDILKSSIIQQYTTEDKKPKPQEIETTSSVSAMKGMFEVDNEDEGSLERVKVKRKIIEMPIAKEEEQVTRKSSYEWQYKKKSIQDLQNFMSTNQNFVSDNVSKAVEDVGDLLEEAVTKEADLDEAMIDAEVEGYTKMKNEVEDYLNAPDRCKEEIEFKEQIEKYLDLVEMPSKEKEHVDTSTLGRKPKKLNLSLYIKNSESPSEIKDVETSPLYAKSKESASIKDLQNKLFVENRSSKDMSKEVIVHNAGTDSLKRGFEKLKKEDKVELITAPKVAPQKFFSDFINEANSSAAKSLDQLKSDGKETTWRWKQKAIGDLHTYMTGHLTKASKAVVESHKNMLKADIELQKAQSSKAKADNEHILKITQERDEEMDKFLQNVKDYLDEPNISNKADPIKTGIQSYLSLIEEGTKEQLTLDKGVSKKFLPSGQVCGVKEQLENQSSNTIPKQSKSTIGKIKTNGLSANETKSNSLKRHSSNSHNAEDIKDHLVKKFFNNQESKDSLMKAPKTRLVQQPKSESENKPIKPKKEWKPPIKNDQSFDPLPKPEFFKWKEEEKKAKEKEQYVSKYAHITDEEEKKAAILAQFGCKPRPAKEVVESSSSSSSEEEEDMTNYIENDLMKNNDLYVIYGDRLKASSPPRQKKKPLKKQADSVECLKGILGQLRRGPSTNELDSDSDDDLSLSQSPEKSYIPGSCSNIRARFENDSSPNNYSQQKRVVEKSRSFSNVGRLYEQSMEEKTDVRNNTQFVPPVGKLNRSSVHYEEKTDMRNNTQFVPPVGKLNRSSVHYGPVGGIPRAFLPNKGLAKSASFHKLKHSFEAGQFDESDSEDEDEDVIKGNSDQRSQIECELEEIRSSTRVQKMFSINKSKYPTNLERSSSSSAIPDHAKFPVDENLSSVSEARNSIKNIFEASASKVTYGGGKTLTEQLREKEKTPEPDPQPAKKKVQFSDRTWVLNTINKYFDVIEEDEDEEGDYDEDYYNEEDEDENYSDEDEEDDEDQVFATQVSAQRVVYGALPQHLPPKAPQFIQQQQEVYESEEEYEEEIELEEESEEEEEIPRQPLSTSLLQKSASSSRIRGLFQSVLQRSDSGTDRDVSNFKANLTRHLKRRESFNSNTNLASIQREYRSDSESDEDDFEDCPEDPIETNKFYRYPL